MLDLTDFYAASPYGWTAVEKAARQMPLFRGLVAHHAVGCPEYGRLLALAGGGEPVAAEDLPPLPVRLFKDFALKSVPDDTLVKTMTSSGTTGQAVSRIFLDKDTALAQTKTLAAIMKSYLGNKRLPMVIIDAKSVLKDPRMFSARGAGILGLSNFGYDHFYALDDSMALDREGLAAFIAKHSGGPVLFFGFTYMVWIHFYMELKKSGISLSLDDGILVHAGGWKKLLEMAVDNDTFKAGMREVCGNIRVHNFYGMVEQTGSVYMECEEGYFHASNFSQLVIRDLVGFHVLPFGETGVIETLSVLPWSYPGHALLTEDLGLVHGEDDCRCGRLGRYFSFRGRLPKAETRGCSDTYAVETGN